MKRVYCLIFVILFFSCRQQKEKVDYILKDAVIYSMNDKNEVFECVAVKNDKIVFVGSHDEVLNKFTSDSIVSLKGKFIYPAFTDAHAHFFGLANFLGECNLYGTKSVKEVIDRLIEFRKNVPNRNWLIGRGWDQNLFENKQFPSKESLDSVFSDIPVCLVRVDGHAIWTNSKAIDMAGIKRNTKIAGGEVIVNNNGNLKGIFVDNATTLIEKHVPKVSEKEMIQLLMKADGICQKNHIQYVHEAGLEKWQIILLDSLIDAGLIITKIYAMALPTSENIQYAIQNGMIDKKRFKLKSFKIYVDGALGSRGALLKKNYEDKDDYGLLLISLDSLDKVLKLLYNKGFQVCTHAIGDSANKIVLQMYARYLKKNDDRRWRVEHAQVVDSSDRWYFREYKIIPSVQPTHAISDKNWAVNRLGTNRIQFAYSCQSLWKQNKLLALGTDFPVEEVSPFKTFYAAVFRSDYDLKDTTVFLGKEKLSRVQTLRGMTIDAAYAGFYEKESGRIEAGKNAEFTILDFDLMTVSKEDLSQWIFQKKLN